MVGTALVLLCTFTSTAPSPVAGSSPSGMGEGATTDDDDADHKVDEPTCGENPLWCATLPTTAFFGSTFAGLLAPLPVLVAASFGALLFPTLFVIGSGGSSAFGWTGINAFFFSGIVTLTMLSIPILVVGSLVPAVLTAAVAMLSPWTADALLVGGVTFVGTFVGGALATSMLAAPFVSLYLQAPSSANAFTLLVPLSGLVPLASLAVVVGAVAGSVVSSVFVTWFVTRSARDTTTGGDE